MRTRQRPRPARRATGLHSCAASRRILNRRVTATGQFHTVEAAGTPSVHVAEPELGDRDALSRAMADLAVSESPRWVRMAKACCLPGVPLMTY
jgi:hypothetical protein